MAEKFIDIEKLIADKNPRLLKRMPGFVLRYLKRKMHEDDINKIIDENKDNIDYDFCVALVKRFKLTIKATGLENIPKTGGAIFASNHPLGGMDAAAIVYATHSTRQDIKFIVNDVLLRIPNLKNLVVGVNKHGINTKESIEELNKLFESEQAIFVFPSGLVSRRIRGKVQDLEWKKTFITRAKKYNREIIPVYIDGELENFFYRLANFRKFIGIKANIEMFYLVDQVFQQENKTITVNFGKPIPSSTFDKTKKDLEWADWVKKEVYKMSVKKK